MLAVKLLPAWLGLAFALALALALALAYNNLMAYNY